MSFALVSPNMTFSSVYITDYTLLLYSHYAALWASEQHNGSYVLPGTSWYTKAHTQIHSDTVTDSITWPFFKSFHFSPDMSFVSIPDMNPSSSCLAQAKTHPLVQPCIILQQPPPQFSSSTLFESSAQSSSCTSASVWLFYYRLQSQCSSFPALAPGLAFASAPRPHIWLQTFRPTSSLSTLHPLCPPAPAPRLSSVYSQPQPYHPVQARKQVFRLGPVSMCHSPPLSTGGLVGNAAKYFWFRGREGCWLRLVGVAVFVLLCFLDNRLVERYLFTPPNHWHTFRANLTLYLTRSHFHKSASAETVLRFLTGTECAREELKSKLLFLKGQ